MYCEYSAQGDYACKSKPVYPVREGFADQPTCKINSSRNCNNQWRTYYTEVGKEDQAKKIADSRFGAPPK